MRALVTGATGFVGSHLVERLVATGWDVASLVRPGRTHVVGEPRATSIAGDLAALDPARRAIRDFAPEVVFHLAWAGVRSADRDDPIQVETNLPGTLALFRMVAEAGCRVFVGLGSQAEYGPCDEVIDEDRPLAPRTLYGAAKASAGLLLSRLAAVGDIRLAWLRLFSCYGPGDRESALIPDLIRRLADGRPASITDWDRPWDYLHVADAARAIERCALESGASGAFNLASGRPTTLRRVAERLRAVVGGESEIVPIRSPVPLPSLRADVSRLRSATGWSPSIDLDDGLRATATELAGNLTNAPRPTTTGGRKR